ncbi:MAG: HpcH/HpaI aldolase/citrate lyase family protein [Candidatus Tectimicrobiota bacterium]
MRENRLKKTLQTGQVAVGVGVRYFRSWEIAAMMASAGFDFLFIDTEHSAYSLETVSDLCHAAMTGGLTPVVRIPEIHASLLSRPLDVGAMGLVIPHVDTRAQVEAIVAFTKYAPVGKRGMASQTPHTDFTSQPAAEYTHWANTQLMNIIMIESAESVANLDSMLQVGHIDVALVGSSDLSQELGIPGNYEHEKMVECYQHVLDVCMRRQVIPGLAGVSDIRLVQHWRDQGFRFLYCANETHLLVQGGRRIVEAVRPVSV